MINTITTLTPPNNLDMINRDIQYKVLKLPITRSQLCTEDRTRIQTCSNNISNNIISPNQEWFKSQCMCKCRIIKITSTTIMINLIMLRINISNFMDHNMVIMVLDMSSHKNSSGIRNFGKSLLVKLAKQMITSQCAIMSIVSHSTLWCMKLTSHSIGSSSLSTRSALLHIEWTTSKCSWITLRNCVLNIKMSKSQKLHKKRPR